MTDDARSAITAIALAIAEAAKAGRWQTVEDLSGQLRGLRIALEHGTHVDRTSMNVQAEPDVTSAELAERGKRIAQGHAKGDPRKLAVSRSKWRSIANYADQRFGLARSTFSNYMAGRVEPPDDVKAKVAKDFPGVDFWTPPVPPKA